VISSVQVAHKASSATRETNGGPRPGSFIKWSFLVVYWPTRGGHRLADPAFDEKKKEIVCAGMNWMYLVWIRVQWGEYVNKVMNCGFHKM
jgi:hypothetical protein